MSKEPIEKVVEKTKQRGGTRAGSGRKPGTPNKVTTNAREAFVRLVEGNMERMQGWLDEIAETDGPKAAFQCLMDAAEYTTPKLARTDITARLEVRNITPEHAREILDAAKPR